MKNVGRQDTNDERRCAFKGEERMLNMQIAMRMSILMETSGVPTGIAERMSLGRDRYSGIFSLHRSAWNRLTDSS